MSSTHNTPSDHSWVSYQNNRGYYTQQVLVASAAQCTNSHPSAPQQARDTRCYMPLRTAPADACLNGGSALGWGRWGWGRWPLKWLPSPPFPSRARRLHGFAPPVCWAVQPVQAHITHKGKGTSRGVPPNPQLFR